MTKPFKIKIAGLCAEIHAENNSTRTYLQTKLRDFLPGKKESTWILKSIGMKSLSLTGQCPTSPLLEGNSVFSQIRIQQSVWELSIRVRGAARSAISMINPSCFIRFFSVSLSFSKNQEESSFTPVRCTKTATAISSPVRPTPGKAQYSNR